MAKMGHLGCRQERRRRNLAELRGKELCFGTIGTRRQGKLELFGAEMEEFGKRAKIGCTHHTSSVSAHDFPRNRIWGGRKGWGLRGAQNAAEKEIKKRPGFWAIVRRMDKGNEKAGGG